VAKGAEAPPAARSRAGALLWATRAGAAVAQLLIVWLPPVPLGQDLPQHLACARILRDLADPALPFERYYEAAPFQVYSITHHAMAALSAGGSIVTAGRILMSVYVLGFLAAYELLVRVADDRPGPRWAGLAGNLFVWSPVVLMGFLPFYLGVPLLLVTWAAVLRSIEGGSRWAAPVAVLASALVSLVHPFLAACSAASGLALLLTPGGRRRLFALVPVGVAVAVFAMAAALGGGGLGSFAGADLGDAVRQAHGLEFVNSYFRFDWSDLPTRLNYLSWSVLGPFRWDGLLLSAAGLVALGLVARRGGGRESPGDRTAVRGAGRLGVALLVLGWLAPFGLYVPTELTFVNLRLLGLGVVAASVALAVRLPRTPPVRGALVALCLLHTANVGYRSWLFAGDAAPALALIERADRERVLLSVVLHNRTRGFGKLFRLTHFLPMYYTVERDGIATQFWARYTSHLPIGYRDGMQPAQPPDWLPRELRLSHLRDSDYLLVQYAAPSDDPRAVRALSDRIRRTLRGAVEPVECRGLFCLYRIPEP
jgi:hypothetical protein